MMNLARAGAGCGKKNLQHLNSDWREPKKTQYIPTCLNDVFELISHTKYVLWSVPVHAFLLIIINRQLMYHNMETITRALLRSLIIQNVLHCVFIVMAEHLEQ